MHMFANILLISSMLFLAASLVAVQQLIKKLPLGGVRNNWKFLSFFIVGAMLIVFSYLATLWTGMTSFNGITISASCFAVSAFVLLLCFLTYQTTCDIREAISIDQASIIDPILDIYNRRYFDRRIDEETQRSRRYKLPLSLIIFEVDQFNEVIDKHDKLVGDLVLRKVSDLIVGTVRASDIVARLEHQKIAVATTQTEEDMAVLLANRLRENIEQLEILPNQEQTEVSSLLVTVSAGVSCVLDSVKNGFELVDIAEKALSNAKYNGTNKVYTYDPTETVSDREAVASVA